MILEWKEVAKDGWPETNDPNKLFWSIVEAWQGEFYISDELRNIDVLIQHGNHIKYYAEVEFPAIPDFLNKPEPKYLTFTEALRVILDGGKVKPSIFTNEFCLENLQQLMEAVSTNNLTKNSSWTIVETAPKPKMPEELKEFNYWMNHYFIDLLSDHALQKNSLTEIFHQIFKKLQPLLNLYQE